MTYEAFEVVVVPFPFTDKPASKHRPGVVISNGTVFNQPSGHVVLAMITSLKNAPWPLDVPILDLAKAGLPTPSKVRMKLFTLDELLILRKAGRLAPEDRDKVQDSLRRLLAL